MQIANYRVVTLTTLVREDEAEEVKDGLINLSIHNESLSAYSEIRELTPEDQSAFGAIIEDDEDEG